MSSDSFRPFRDATVTLPDGRAMAYAEFGAPDGRPVFWFHGTPGGRWQIPPDAPDAARQRGLRLIGIDRPGTGGSSHDPQRTLLSWARDLERVADALGIEQFAVIGLSGGGPYVLACAHELADRMGVGVSLGGVGPTVGSDSAPGYPRTSARRSPRPDRGENTARHCAEHGGEAAEAVFVADFRPLRPFRGAHRSPGARTARDAGHVHR